MKQTCYNFNFLGVPGVFVRRKLYPNNKLFYNSFIHRQSAVSTVMCRKCIWESDLNYIVEFGVHDIFSWHGHGYSDDHPHCIEP